MPEISIIVPVYRAEQYLTRCVDSLLAQTFTDFELLLIDDASPDKSGELCDILAKKDSRIRVLHKQTNAGASAARNTGLDMASGNYVMFCDSDDVVSPHWAKRLHDLSAKNTLPISTFCTEIEHLGTERSLGIPKEHIFPIDQYFAFNRCGLAGYITNAIYENDIIQACRLRFRSQRQEGDYNEDLLFALQYVSHMKQLVYTGYADYLYDVHEGSLSRSYQKYYFAKYAEKYRLWREFAGTDALPELASTYLYYFLTAMHMEQTHFSAFRSIVQSAEMQECLQYADTAKENPRIIRLLKKKAVLRLWLSYRLHSLKG